MKPLQVYISNEIMKSLKLRAIEMNTTVSELVRQKLGNTVEVVVTESLPAGPSKRAEEIKQKIIKTPAQAVIATENIRSKPKHKECKNGHMLNKWGRCSQKGCKYD